MQNHQKEFSGKQLRYWCYRSTVYSILYCVCTVLCPKLRMLGGGGYFLSWEIASVYLEPNTMKPWGKGAYSSLSRRSGVHY